MKNLKKYREWFMPFSLLLVLIIVYKSLDNLSAVGEYISNFFRIVRPFVIGFVIAYIFNLPCKKIQNLLLKCKNRYIQKKSKSLSILIVYILALLVVFFVVRALVPAIYKNAIDLYNNIPAYIETLSTYIEDWQNRVDIKLFTADSKMNISKAIEDFIKSINLNEFSKYAQGVINLTSGVINTFIAIIVSVYMLIDKERIKKGIKSVFTVLFSEEKTERVSTIIANINNVFSKYIYCRVIDGLIMGILSIIILSLLGVRYALVLGTLVGFCNLIPYFGSIIGSVITTLITIVTGGFFKGLWTLITLTVLEQIDGNLIGPKIMGDVLEIRPLVIIFAVTVGGGLFGVLGMLFSVPIFVVLKMMGEEYLVAKQGEKEKKQS